MNSTCSCTTNAVDEKRSELDSGHWNRAWMEFKLALRSNNWFRIRLLWLYFSYHSGEIYLRDHCRAAPEGEARPQLVTRVWRGSGGSRHSKLPSFPQNPALLCLTLNAVSRRSANSGSALQNKVSNINVVNKFHLWLHHEYCNTPSSLGIFKINRHFLDDHLQQLHSVTRFSWDGNFLLAGWWWWTVTACLLLLCWRTNKQHVP